MVRRIEVLRSDASGNEDDDWSEALWKHHEFFQEAVILYVVALSPIDTTRLDRRSYLQSSLVTLQVQGHQQGRLSDSVAKYFCPDQPTEEVSPEACFTAALNGKDRSEEAPDAFLKQTNHSPALAS